MPTEIPLLSSVVGLSFSVSTSERLFDKETSFTSDLAPAVCCFALFTADSVYFGSSLN